MGFAYQTYPIVGGTVLIIERVESNNYDAGVAGWAIFADGDAEFANLLARGSLSTGAPGSLHAEVTDNGLFLYSGQADEQAPGSVSIFNVGSTDIVTIQTPSRAGAHDALIQLVQNDNAVDSEIVLNSDSLSVVGEPSFSLYAKAVTAVTYVNGASTNAGRGAVFYKDAMGVVHLTGRVNAGSLNSNMFVLPADCRPVEALPFPVIINSTTLGGCRVDPGGGVVLQTGALTNVSLSGISFPTF